MRKIMVVWYYPPLDLIELFEKAKTYKEGLADFTAARFLGWEYIGEFD